VDDRVDLEALRALARIALGVPEIGETDNGRFVLLLLGGRLRGHGRWSCHSENGGEHS
jgi:hypothetical protein